MKDFEGLGDIVLGVACLFAAPVAVCAAAGIVAAAGAVAVTAGIATEAGVVAGGITAMGVAETSVITTGMLMVESGVKKVAG